MANIATELEVRTQTYDRQRYACHLRIGWKRLERIEDAPAYSLNPYRLVDSDGVKRTLTKFLRRRLSQEITYQSAVSGEARVSSTVDFGTNIPAVRGEVNVFTNVRPEHTKSVERVVDEPKADRVVFPYLVGGIA